MNRTRHILTLMLLCLAAPLSAQEKPAVPSGPPLASFTALRVSIFPAQLWHADSAGWSRSVNWASTRLALDSTVQSLLEERGLGKKWAYASDVVRVAKRNPTYAGDPYALGVSGLRGVVLKVGDATPQVVGDNLRPFTAIGDTRHALIPVEVRAQGDSVVLRLVLADTRTRTLLWHGDLASPGGPRWVETLATRIANLIIEP